MRFEIYPSKDGYRWRLVAKNNKIVADSGEAYNSYGNAHRAAKMVRNDVRTAEIVHIKESNHE